MTGSGGITRVCGATRPARACHGYCHCQRLPGTHTYHHCPCGHWAANPAAQATKLAAIKDRLR